MRVTDAKEYLDTVRIHSVLAVAKLADSLPVGDLASANLFGTAVAQLRRSSLSSYLGESRRYVSLFANGSVSVRGCSSVREAREVLHSIKERLSMLVETRKGSLNVRIRNIVASVSLGAPLDLSLLAEVLPIEEAMYEPEQFPGLMLRKPDDKAVALVFHSGKVVIVGTRTARELEHVIIRTINLLLDVGVLEPRRAELRG